MIFDSIVSKGVLQLLNTLCATLCVSSHSSQDLSPLPSLDRETISDANLFVNYKRIISRKYNFNDASPFHLSAQNQ